MRSRCVGICSGRRQPPETIFKRCLRPAGTHQQHNGQHPDLRIPHDVSLVVIQSVATLGQAGRTEAAKGQRCLAAVDRRQRADETEEAGVNGSLL